MTQGELPQRPSFREEALFLDSDGKLKTLNGTTGEVDDVEVAFTEEGFSALNLSTLPTSDPGGGKPWLNGGVLQVGP